MNTDKRAVVEATTRQDQATQQLADEQWDLFQVAKVGHGEYLKRADKCSRFYLSDQWEKKDLDKLARQGRPALTINQVLPIVNTVLGEQATRRAEVKFKPVRDADSDDAALIGKTYAYVCDQNMYDWVESQVFADGVIEERGFFDIRVDFDENLFGHIKIVSDDPGDVIPDPEAKSYDPNDWGEVWYTRWASLDYIELNYGVDKRRALEHLANEGVTRGTDSFRFYEREKQSFGSPDTQRWFEGVQPSEQEKRRVKLIRIIERQFKKLHWQWYFVDPITGDKRAVPPTWEEQRITEFALKMGLYVSKVRAERIRWRVTADSVVLMDEWSPYRTFTKVPFFPYFRRGRSSGVVTALISPQEMVNKISSQVTHVVNTTANSGWVVERNSLANMTTAQLEQRGAETGLVMEVHPGTQIKPEKIRANQIPTGLERIAQTSQMNMKAISGITDAMLGQEREVSGVAMTAKQNRGQVQLQVPLDNLAKTRHMVVRKVLELIQQFMTEQRILTIVNERPMPGQPETEQLMINQQTAAGVLNDITRGSYTWVISSQPARDTFNDSQFSEAMQLAEAGIPIPPDRIVEYSSLERKHELAEEIRQMSGRGTPTEQEMEMAEIQQQMAMMQQQLMLNEMQAKIQKLQSEAAYNYAKTGEIDENIQRAIEKMEQEVQLAREGFDVRMNLAKMQNTGKLENTAMSHYAKQSEQVTGAALAHFARPQTNKGEGNNA